jgi:hypothetical protein
VVVLWQAGPDAGIYGIALADGAPFETTAVPTYPRWSRMCGFGSQSIKLHYVYVLPEPLLKTTLDSCRVLSKLAVVRKRLWYPDPSMGSPQWIQMNRVYLKHYPKYAKHLKENWTHLPKEVWTGIVPDLSDMFPGLFSARYRTDSGVLQQVAAKLSTVSSLGSRNPTSSSWQALSNFCSRLLQNYYVAALHCFQKLDFSLCFSRRFAKYAV